MLANLLSSSFPQDLFFQFFWNNTLHHVVEEMVYMYLNGESSDLRPPILTKFRLIERILDAHEQAERDWVLHVTPHKGKGGETEVSLSINSADVEEKVGHKIAPPKIHRRGYMGHVFRIANSIVTAASKYPEVEAALAENEEWHEFVREKLKEVNEQQTMLIGGEPPQRNAAPELGSQDWANWIALALSSFSLTGAGGGGGGGGAGSLGGGLGASIGGG
eukprot:tig00000113_g5603.t1